MKIVTELFQEPVSIMTDKVTCLVIENQDVFRRFLLEIHAELSGDAGKVILSDDNTILKMAKSVELITEFVSFSLNEKRLLTKLNVMLEQMAANEEHYTDVLALLSETERLMLSISADLPCAVDFTGLQISSLVKMAGVQIVNDSENEIETVFLYMQLVRELLGEKLFIFVNMRAFFSDKDMQDFVDTVTAHQFYVLLLDGHEYATLDRTRGFILDYDLCVI